MPFPGSLPAYVALSFFFWYRLFPSAFFLSMPPSSIVILTDALQARIRLFKPFLLYFS